ncbi:DUF2071 domain-containing protein [Oceanobacter mangrovi]|uniref:DUF2071 domain-containing protein n=1 Tax=Oceanobacter mangrovi TaxID=2862510 RepID=UPI001C8E9858|nr:DUF2071 domain-containing protein [Oceanobacter mangrovi]
MTSNRFVTPRGGMMTAVFNWLANSSRLAAIRRAVLSRLPFLQLQSDVSTVVYLNWVVPLPLAQAAVPAGVELVSVGNKTILTILSYQHGHFGPASAVRKWMPSPLQSNWRFYVNSANGLGPAAGVVVFIRNVFDNLAYAVGSRVFSDALPSHLANSFLHQQRGDEYLTEITAASGSAPELYSRVRPCETPKLPAGFEAFYPSWSEAVAALTQQDSAICAVSDTGMLAQAGIDLPIPLDEVIACECLEFRAGALLEQLGVEGQPFCFVVPEVRFRVLWERIIWRP